MGTEKIFRRRDAVERAREHREDGKCVVFTNGCFDLLHVGHLHALMYAKSLGDVLLVALNSDESVRRLKGPRRPLFPEDERALLLACLECVDMVTLFHEDTPLELLRQVQPQVLVKGAQYDTHLIVGASDVLSWGGRVEKAPMVQGRSTTELIQRIQRMEADPRSESNGMTETSNGETP